MFFVPPNFYVSFNLSSINIKLNFLLPPNFYVSFNLSRLKIKLFISFVVPGFYVSFNLNRLNINIDARPFCILYKIDKNKIQPGI